MVDLIINNIREITRSRDFSRKIVFNIIMGLLFMIMALNFLLLGYMLDEVVRDVYGKDAGVINTVSGWLLYYLLIDIIMRINFQQLKSASGKPYMIMNVPRSRIVALILMKVPLNSLNVFPALILLPFFFKSVLPVYGILSSVSWLLSVCCLLLMNNYLVNYLKTRFIKNPVVTGIFIAAVFIIYILERIGMISIQDVGAVLFGNMIQQSYLLPLYILLPAVTIFVNYSFIRSNFHLDSFAHGGFMSKAGTGVGAFEKFGLTGWLMNNEIKMMMRNKRTRISLYMPALFVFYGLLFYSDSRYLNGGATEEYFMFFIGLFITGFFSMASANVTYSYEGNFFGYMLTKNYEIEDFLRAKYYLILSICSITWLISFFYYFVHPRIVLINTAAFFFVVGFAPFFMMFISTFNKQKLNLSLDSFSLQGKGPSQFMAVFALLLLVAVIFVPVRYFSDSSGITFSVLGALGLAGIALHNNIISLLAKLFQSRKYIMSEGFRNS
ncbi:MAG: hypothetical protein HUU43_06690 [Ignavibacteriaceae bacterium]|nr:hypothetical protein [Ignavibacteriaceae bacterium]